MKYTLTISTDSTQSLRHLVEALNGILSDATEAHLAVDQSAMAELTKNGDVVEKAPAEKKRKAKATNGKAKAKETEDKAEEAAEDPLEEEDAPTAPTPRAVLEQALVICRALLETDNDLAKRDLRALRDSFNVKKLSDVPLDQADKFLAKARRLQTRHAE